MLATDWDILTLTVFVAVRHIDHSLRHGAHISFLPAGLAGFKGSFWLSVLIHTKVKIKCITLKSQVECNAFQLLKA